MRFVLFSASVIAVLATCASAEVEPARIAADAISEARIGTFTPEEQREFGPQIATLRARIAAQEEFYRLHPWRAFFKRLGLIPDPDMKEHVQRGHKKGLGIFLMRQIMDEVRYKFKDGVKNELTLVKFIR